MVSILLGTLWYLHLVHIEVSKHLLKISYKKNETCSSQIAGPKHDDYCLQEDEKVIELVRKYGAKKWTVIAKHLRGRIGKQCRERWHNHLNPAIKKSAWTRKSLAFLFKLVIH